jgi:hypothetical protein
VNGVTALAAEKKRRETRESRDLWLPSAGVHLPASAVVI